MWWQQRCLQPTKTFSDTKFSLTQPALSITYLDAISGFKQDYSHPDIRCWKPAFCDLIPLPLCLSSALTLGHKDLLAGHLLSVWEIFWFQCKTTVWPVLVQPYTRTRPAVCLDKSEVVVTRLAVHEMISHNCLCMIYHADLPTWLRGLRLSELQCSEPGWLASSAGHGFISRSCQHVESGFRMQWDYSQAGTDGLPVSSLKCDRPSHLDRRRLVCGESRRCGQQMVGVSCLIGRPRVGTLPEKPAG